MCGEKWKIHYIFKFEDKKDLFPIRFCTEEMEYR